MANTTGNSGNVGEYNVIIYQIEMAAGPCGLTELHSLSPNETGYGMYTDFSADTPSADSSLL